MTARPIAVGDRVRVRPHRGPGSGSSGTVANIEATDTFLPYHVAFDDPRDPSDLRFGAHELVVIDETHHTSSAPLTEDPADSIATPCATSATPDPVDPATVPAPEAGATSVHDAAPVTDLTTLQDAADRLAQVRADLDRLTALEYELATIVTDGLRRVVAVEADLTWCVEPPAGSAS